MSDSQAKPHRQGHRRRDPNSHRGQVATHHPYRRLRLHHHPRLRLGQSLRSRSGCQGCRLHRCLFPQHHRSETRRLHFQYHHRLCLNQANRKPDHHQHHQGRRLGPSDLIAARRCRLSRGGQNNRRCHRPSQEAIHCQWRSCFLAESTPKLLASPPCIRMGK